MCQNDDLYFGQASDGSMTRSPGTHPRRRYHRRRSHLTGGQTTRMDLEHLDGSHPVNRGAVSNNPRHWKEPGSAIVWLLNGYRTPSPGILEATSVRREWRLQMADIRVEECAGHIDGVDMAAIISVLGELGHLAESTDQITVLASPEWSLVLHWPSENSPEGSFDPFLMALEAKVSMHYQNAHKEPPARIEVFDPDGELLAST